MLNGSRVLRLLAAHGQQRLHGNAQLVFGSAPILAHQLGRKAIEPGFDRCMGGEQIAGARRIEGHGEGDPLRAIWLRARSSTANAAWPSFRWSIGLQAGGFQQAPAADAQHQFLAQAHLVVAAIEFAGDQPRDGWIGGVIGIEQQQAIEADPGLPAAQPDLQPGSCMASLRGAPLASCSGSMGICRVSLTGYSACCRPSGPMLWRK